jgi:hypothetical protein
VYFLMLDPDTQIRMCEADFVFRSRICLQGVDNSPGEGLATRSRVGSLAAVIPRGAVSVVSGDSMKTD